jgi:lipopolysaccharide export system protein LptC
MRVKNIFSFALAAFAALLVVRAFAGELPNVPDETVLKGFVDPIHYPPPNQNQLWQVRRAAEARPQGNTNILLIDATVETYTTNGALDLTAHTPICNWDVRSNLASSPSRVSIRSVPGKMFHEADGFLWDNKTQMIYFSNNVHTIIQSEELTASKKP